MFYESVGVLRYYTEPVLKLVVDVDQEVSEYYRSLMPKSIDKIRKNMRLISLWSDMKFRPVWIYGVCTKAKMLDSRMKMLSTRGLFIFG